MRIKCRRGLSVGEDSVLERIQCSAFNNCSLKKVIYIYISINQSIKVYSAFKQAIAIIFIHL